MEKDLLLNNYLIGFQGDLINEDFKIPRPIENTVSKFSGILSKTTDRARKVKLLAFMKRLPKENYTKLENEAKKNVPNYTNLKNLARSKLIRAKVELSPKRLEKVSSVFAINAAYSNDPDTEMNDEIEKFKSGMKSADYVQLGFGGALVTTICLTTFKLLKTLNKDSAKEGAKEFFKKELDQIKGGQSFSRSVASALMSAVEKSTEIAGKIDYKNLYKNPAAIAFVVTVGLFVALKILRLVEEEDDE